MTMQAMMQDDDTGRTIHDYIGSLALVLNEPKTTNYKWSPAAKYKFNKLRKYFELKLVNLLNMISTSNCKHVVLPREPVVQSYIGVICTGPSNLHRIRFNWGRVLHKRFIMVSLMPLLFILENCIVAVDTLHCLLSVSCSYRLEVFVYQVFQNFIRLQRKKFGTQRST